MRMIADGVLKAILDYNNISLELEESKDAKHI
jgi:hypothetical protein